VLPIPFYSWRHIMKKLNLILVLLVAVGMLAGCANQVIPTNQAAAGIGASNNRISQADLQAEIRAQNERELAARAARRSKNP